MNSYELSRSWFDWCFENPDKISPNHSALYFFCIEHCNRMGWKEKFGLPTTMAKEAIGIRSYNTYISTLNDLVGFGFIKLIEKSKNQYSSNIIALSKFNKAHNKALDKASIKHVTKQSESTQQSNSSIDKQVTLEPTNQEQINNLLEKESKRKSSNKIKVEKLRYGEFENVLLTEEEYLKSQEKYGQNLEAMIQKLSAFVATKKKDPYASHFAAFSSWVYKSILEDNQRNGNQGSKQNGNSSQWPNGSANGIQRPVGKQPHVFSGAEFSAKVQERLEDQGLFD